MCLEQLSAPVHWMLVMLREIAEWAGYDQIINPITTAFGDRDNVINVVLIVNQDIAVVASTLLMGVLGLYIFGGVVSGRAPFAGSVVAALGGALLRMGVAVGTVSGGYFIRVSFAVGTVSDGYFTRISFMVGTTGGGTTCLAMGFKSVFGFGCSRELGKRFIFAALATGFGGRIGGVQGSSPWIMLRGVNALPELLYTLIIPKKETRYASI